MAGYFENKLFDLLPPLYRIEDLSACGHAQAGETGDLAALLKVPAVSLDELKELTCLPRREQWRICEIL